jgi:Asp-tRNA(Asn)/Glu-tRNA(Gln) amidotransferase A subunit family amidase
VPALSLPLNLPRVSPQMPLSIQLIGAMGNDAKLLKAANLINIALRPPNHVGSPTNPSGPSHTGQA